MVKYEKTLLMCLELNNNNLIFQFCNMKAAALIPFKLSEYQILHTLGTGIRRLM
jgi:hypothetical protein